jgi:hypothetical protein
MSHTEQVNIRCTSEQHARWSRAAKRAKRKLADWARLKLDEGEALEAKVLKAKGDL